MDLASKGILYFRQGLNFRCNHLSIALTGASSLKPTQSKMFHTRPFTLCPRAMVARWIEYVQFGSLKVASISDTTTVQKVSLWAHKNGPIGDNHFIFLYHSCMPGPSYYFFQPLAGYIFVPQSLESFESTQSQSNPVHCPLWALQSWINNQQQEMELSEPSTNLLLPIDNLKGIVPQKKSVA